jgi:5-methyltetrahydrofolate--homocysteine methyltransferase
MNLQPKIQTNHVLWWSIGPTNRTASMSPDVNDPGYRAVTFDDLRIAYKQQVEALIDGGSDYY